MKKLQKEKRLLSAELEKYQKLKTEISLVEKELNPNTISRFSYIDIRYDNQVIAKRRHS